MSWKLYAVVSAGAFVATYLMSSPQPELAQAKTAAAAPRDARQTRAETEIEALANSLHVHVKSDSVLRPPTRDPFRFHTKAIQAAPVNVPPPPPVVDLPPPAPPLPVLSLSGIASDVVDGKPQRAAVLSAPAGVFIVREGDSVGGLYTVVAIGEDSIDLEAAADRSRRVLRLGR